MIKILSLNVKNFKSLFDTKIEQFKSINLFYGFNNSGKSNIFKFLKILFEKKSETTSINIKNQNESFSSIENTLTRKIDFWSGYIHEPFLFSNNNRSVPITFEVFLEVENTLFPEIEKLKTERFLGKKTTKVKLKGNIQSRGSDTSYLQIEEGLLNNKVFYRNHDSIDYFFEKSKSINKSNGPRILSLFNDLVLLIDSDRNFIEEVAKEGITSMDAKNFKNSLFDLYIKAEKNETFNNLIKFLSDFEFSEEAKGQLKSNLKSFPFNSNTDIGFARFDEEIEIMIKNVATKLPLKNYGTGIQQFLFLLSKIHFNNSKVVIIEELELNLSPLYQKELLRFLKSLIPTLYSQLLFSSHSPYFTQKEAIMIDIIHHVQIDYLPHGGTSVECHDDIPAINDVESNYFYFN